MEPPQLVNGETYRGVCSMPARVRFTLNNDIHFNDSYFAIKLERRLNFEISRAFFAPMKAKVSRSNLS
jgi:hypothetical protein